MKRVLVLTCLIAFLLITACSGKQTPAAPSPTPAPEITPTSEKSDDDVIPPANPSEPGEAAESDDEDGESAPSGPRESNLYDPSIYIIEASGTSRQELAPGYFADYEIEIYLDKVDSNANRIVTGAYDGFLWMKVTLDTEEFIKDMLKDVPVEMQFDAGGEAVCDNFGIYLSNEDDKAWVDFTILDEEGKPLPLTQEMPVARGSCVAVPKDVYLDALAQGKQGETIEHHGSNSQPTDINFVLHVEPNSMEQDAQRKITIQFSGEGFSFTIEGVLRRIPGYPEDVLEYANSDRPRLQDRFFE